MQLVSRHWIITDANGQVEEVKGRGIPEWLDYDAARSAATIKSLPTREQINLPVQEQLIVELYSK